MGSDKCLVVDVGRGLDLGFGHLGEETLGSEGCACEAAAGLDGEGLNHFVVRLRVRVFYRVSITSF